MEPGWCAHRHCLHLRPAQLAQPAVVPPSRAAVPVFDDRNSNYAPANSALVLYMPVVILAKIWNLVIQLHSTSRARDFSRSEAHGGESQRRFANVPWVVYPTNRHKAFEPSTIVMGKSGNRIYST